MTGRRVVVVLAALLVSACEGGDGVRPAAVCTTDEQRQALGACAGDEPHPATVRACAEAVCDPAFVRRPYGGPADTVPVPCTEAMTDEEVEVCGGRRGACGGDG